jgi:glutamate formiminotransferase
VDRAKQRDISGGDTLNEVSERVGVSGLTIEAARRTLAAGPVFQCVPNFSEGRDPALIAAMADAIRAVPGAVLIDLSADVDHHRSVMTIIGPADSIHGAVLAAARVAVAGIDLRAHTGVHPRVGAIDVVPVVPLRDATRGDGAALAERIGQALAQDLGLPVYFYEDNARDGRASALPQLRRGGFEALQAGDLTDSRAPDLGPGRAHPTAGVSVVGARGPLLAYNVNLETPDVEVARNIARSIRRERERVPELEGVRALGLPLASQRRSQVSLNLTRPERTRLPGVFSFIEREAARLGVTDLESEIIGAISIDALGGDGPEAIHWREYKETQILETWLGG